MEKRARFLRGQRHTGVSECGSPFWQELIRNEAKVSEIHSTLVCTLLCASEEMHAVLFIGREVLPQNNYSNIKSALRTIDCLRTIFLKTLIIRARRLTRDKKKMFEKENDMNALEVRICVSWLWLREFGITLTTQQASSCYHVFPCPGGSARWLYKCHVFPHPWPHFPASC